MNMTLSRSRAALLFICLPLAVLVTTSGTGCPGGGLGFPLFPFPPGGDDDFVTFELVNETDFDVDPGIFIEGEYVDLGILAPFEAAPLVDVECFLGDFIDIDPILFDPFDPAFDELAINAPVPLDEGFDYFCGDLITIFYAFDATGAFVVDVAVNDVFLGF